jgi:phytoene synthase
MPTQAAATIADMLRAADRDRYVMALLSPASARADLMALYAFNAELARIRGAVSEPLIGRMKLQWWRDVIDGVYAGRGAPKGNPLTEALAEAVGRRSLERVHFDTMIDARERDLTADSSTELAAIEAYADATASRVIVLALAILAQESPAAVAAGRAVGIAHALTGLLRALAFEIAGGGVRFPMVAGLALPALSDLARAMAARATEHLGKARALRVDIAPGAVPALLPAVIADRTLKAIAACGGDSLHPRLTAFRPGAGSLVWAWLWNRY